MFLRTGLTKSGRPQEGLWDKAMKRILVVHKTGAHTVWLPKADKLEPLLRWLWGKEGATQIPSDSRTRELLLAALEVTHYRLPFLSVAMLESKH